MKRKPNDQYAEIDQAFFDDGYQLAESSLHDSLNMETLLNHLKAQYNIIDSLLESFQHRVIANGVGIDCRKGCAWCCHQEVLVMPGEMLLIADYIEKNFDPDTKKIILHRAVEKDQKVKDLDAGRALQTKIACPLLQDGSCSVYPVRPMACRIYMSSNIDSCLQEFHHPDDLDAYPELFDFPLHAGRMMNSGLIYYLKEKGINVYENRLEKLLRMILKEPERGEKWLSGTDDLSEGHEQVEDIVKLREKT